MKTNKALSLFLAGAICTGIFSCSKNNNFPKGLKENIEERVQANIQRHGAEVLRTEYNTAQSNEGVTYSYKFDEIKSFNSKKAKVSIRAYKQYNESTANYYFIADMDFTARRVSIKEEGVK